MSEAATCFLYLFDPEDRRWRRPWHEMLPAGFREVRIRRESFHTEDGAARDGIILAHGSQLPPERQHGALFATAGAANLEVILVSGGHLDMAAPAANVYIRRSPVRPRQADPVFRACFARFWEDLQETGTPCFPLLEPSRDPLPALALLCQAYFLAHVAPGTTSVVFAEGGTAAGEMATRVLSRLGLTAVTMPAAEGEEARQRQAQVRDPDWWAVLDAGALQAALGPGSGRHPALDLLVARLLARRRVTPDGLVSAYLELEHQLHESGH